MQTDGVNKGETLAGGATRENADGATHENADGAKRENADDSARENAGGASLENADGTERENAGGATDENADDAMGENADISPRRVLIAGAGSYIGTSFARWAAEHYPRRIKTKEVSMHGDAWRKEDFSKYDAVLHVAGIAHKKPGSVSDREYYDVNARLAIESAKKARREGVLQFVLLSSMSIYGDSGSFGRRRVITGNEKPQPTSAYGGSKWLADRKVRALQTGDFRVAVLRPPMVYGSGCKGNYPSLEKMAKKLPVFPDVKNRRSMIYIDNLSEFICQLVLDGRGGVFFPQNGDLVCTADLVRWIAEECGHRIAVTRALRSAVILASRLPEKGPLGRIRGLADKAFGNMAYEPSMSRYDWADYQIVGTRESVREMARAARETDEMHAKGKSARNQECRGMAEGGRTVTRGGARQMASDGNAQSKATLRRQRLPDSHPESSEKNIAAKTEKDKIAGLPPYSVLMAVYKKDEPPYLDAAIGSMMNQSVVADDFVIVCDGPITKGLDGVLCRYEREFPGIFQIIRLPENQGLGNALREGMKRCRNELVARMDSDDIAMPYRCEHQLAAFSADRELALCSGDIAEFDEDPEIVHSVRHVPESQEEILKFSKMRSPMNHMAVMFKKSAVERAGGYGNAEANEEDYDLWVRMLHGGCRAANISEILVKVRVGNGMYRRRGGISYVKSNLMLNKKMLSMGYISFPEYVRNCLVRIVSSSIPSGLRKGLYRTLLRKKATADDKR